jgi:hypothetical protein
VRAVPRRHRMPASALSGTGRPAVGPRRRTARLDPRRRASAQRSGSRARAWHSA